MNESKKPITAQEFDEFSSQKELKTECPVCGKEEWVLVDPPEAQTWAFNSLPLHENGGVAIPPPGIPVITLVCDHCFYIRAHAYMPLRRWLDESKNEETTP